VVPRPRPRNRLDAGPIRGAGARFPEIEGHHSDLDFRGHTIGNTEPAAAPTVGVLVSPFARGIRSENNQFRNVQREIETEK
jgi:hypothetical protein